MDFDLTINYVALPGLFTTLLKSNMQTHSKAYLAFTKAVLEDDQLYSITHQTFSHGEKKLNVEFVLKSYGWLGFRDKVAANYIHHYQNGLFSKNVDTKLVQDILTFEKTFSFLCLDGYSRVFLLGFYLKLSPNLDLAFSALQNSDFVKVLKKSQGRHHQADFFILTSLFFYQTLGKKFISALDSRKKFSEMTELLSSEDRRELLSICLKYGASINDTSLFIPDVV